MNEISIDDMRDAIRKMNEMTIPRKVQEDLLLSQELYDQLKEHARPYVPNIDTMPICRFEGIVVRVDPDLTGNQYRWDDSKAKESALPKFFDNSGQEITMPWYEHDTMKMWDRYFGKNM